MEDRNENKARFYLPNLNGVRAIAAIMVLIHHVEQMRHIQGMESLWYLQGIKSLGKIAVVLFFTLSGFLITYLIEQEKKNKGSLNILDFYIRRSLRIWPLYYLIVLTGLFLLPEIDFLRLPSRGYHNLLENRNEAIAMYLLFIPNYFLNYIGAIPLIAHTWSIGIEEQFYLIWPWIVRNVKKPLRNIIIFLICYNLLRIIAKLILSGEEEFIYFPPLNALAIGGIFGILFIKSENRQIPDWILSKKVQIISLVIAGFFVLKGTYIPGIYFEFYAIIFGINIFYLSSLKSILNLENSILNFLGKISYGIYMYHPLVIHLAFSLLLRSKIANHYLYYFLIFSLSILISWLSYEFLESKFIRLKKKFTHILTGSAEYRRN